MQLWGRVNAVSAFLHHNCSRCLSPVTSLCPPASIGATHVESWLNETQSKSGLLRIPPRAALRELVMAASDVGVVSVVPSLRFEVFAVPGAPC